MRPFTARRLLALALGAAATIRAEIPLNPPNRPVAYGLAATGTLATVAAGAFTALEGAPRTGFGIMAAGLVLAPSLGQVYAGSSWQGAAGATVRGIGVTLFAVGLAQGMEFCDEEGCKSSRGDALETTGLLILGLGLVHGLLDTHFAVSRAEERFSHAGVRYWELHPVLALSRDGESTVGGQATVHF